MIITTSPPHALVKVEVSSRSLVTLPRDLPAMLIGRIFLNGLIIQPNQMPGCEEEGRENIAS